MPKGNNSDYKVIWLPYLLFLFKEAAIYELHTFYYTAIFMNIVYDTEVVDTKPI